MVFDGGFALVSGARMTDHNVPFAQTSRWIRQHEERDYAGTEFPFTYQTVYDPRTGKTDGILNRCSATRTCPKIFHIDSDYESWRGHISLVGTDTEGHELRKPEGFGSGSERHLDSAVYDNNVHEGVLHYSRPTSHRQPGDRLRRRRAACRQRADGGGQRGREPAAYRAVSFAPLCVVAQAYRAAGAEVFNLLIARGPGPEE